MAIIIQLPVKKKEENVSTATRPGPNTWFDEIRRKMIRFEEGHRVDNKELEKQLVILGSKYGYNNLKLRFRENNNTVALTYKDDFGILRIKIEKYVVPPTNSFYCEVVLTKYLRGLIYNLENFGHI